MSLATVDESSRRWLERCRPLIADPESVAAGWVAIADADVAMSEGALAEALRHANASVRIGEKTGDPDLLGMGLQALGRAEIIGDPGWELPGGRCGAATPGGNNAAAEMPTPRARRIECDRAVICSHGVEARTG